MNDKQLTDADKRRTAGNFEIWKRMSEKDSPPTLWLTGVNNIKRANTGKDGYGEVVVAVSNELIMRMSEDFPPFMQLLIFEQGDYFAVKKSLEDAAISKSEEG